MTFWKFQYTKIAETDFQPFFSEINCLDVLCCYLFPVCYYFNKTKQAIANPNNPKHPNMYFFLLFFNSYQWYSIGKYDTDLKMFFLVPFGYIVYFLVVYYSKVIKFSELCICTKQIICGYLGFELFIFLFLSFSCCYFLIRVELFRCFIGFLVNPFDIKSRVPIHTLPLFSLFLSEEGLFSSCPMLLQTTKLAEKFPVGILDPAQNSQ